MQTTAGKNVVFLNNMYSLFPDFKSFFYNSKFCKALLGVAHLGYGADSMSEIQLRH